jgi:hypothetical protein
MRARLRTTARAAALAVVAGVGLTLAPTSVASRAPTPSEKKAILRAAPSNPYPKGGAARKVRVSTVDSRWAAVYITANPGHHNQVQPDVASTYHTRHHGWVLHQEGNGGGCGVPARVRNDLHLNCY